MQGTSTDTGTAISAVVYAGRLAGRVRSAGLPEGCRVLGDWDVLPSSLAAATEEADALIVVDPFSFPFEAMEAEQWDLPLVVVLPPGHDAAFVDAVFGEPVLGRLGFFDRVATADTALWGKLRRVYGWGENQRVEIGSPRPEEAAAEVCARLEAEAALPAPSVGERYEAISYWRECGDALAAAAPHRAVFGGRYGPRPAKAVHRVQAAAIEPQFVAAWGDRAADSPFDVLEVGVGVGRWASRFDPDKTSFVGVDVSGGMVEAARANLPDRRFDLLDEDMTLPHADESFDLAFSVSVLHHNPTPAKRKLVSEMWRVTRTGGRLVFLEDFVVEGWTERSTVYPMPVLGFVDLLREATAGQVVLEHVEAIRYPQDAMYRGGLLSVSKLGVPKTW